MILAIFHLQVNLLLHHKFQLNSPCFLRKDTQNKIFKMAAVAAILDFRLIQFKLILIQKLSCCYRASFSSNRPNVWKELKGGEGGGERGGGTG